MSALHEMSVSASSCSSRPSMMITCSRLGRSSRIAFTLESSFGVVTIALPSARPTRSAIGSGPKAENSGAASAPSLSAPKKAKYSSGMRSLRKKTRSPFSMPALRSALAGAVRLPL